MLTRPNSSGRWDHISGLKIEVRSIHQDPGPPALYYQDIENPDSGGTVDALPESDWFKWKEPAMPRSVVQMVPVDHYGRVLVMHRSANVRSIPNVWSFPSGLHDIGETINSAAARELAEEFGLLGIDSMIIAQYENIAGDDPDKEQYHWLITLMAVLVEDVTKAVNHEPDKHDMMKGIPVNDLIDEKFWTEHPFHSSFHKQMVEGGGRHRLALACQEVAIRNNGGNYRS